MDATSLVDRYCDVWNEADEISRGRMLSSLWMPGAVYCDPQIELTGADQLLAHIGSVRAKYPGASTRRVSTVDVHHGVARFSWVIVQPNGEAISDGTDIAFISADASRIERVIGFFGPLASRRT